MRASTRCGLMGLLLLSSFQLLAQDNKFFSVAEQAAKDLTQALNSKLFADKVSYVEQHLAAATIQRTGGVSNYANYLSAESFFHGKLNYQTLKVIESDKGIIEADVRVVSKNTQLPYRIELSILADASEQMTVPGTTETKYKVTRIRLRAVEPESESIKNVQVAAAKLEAYINQLAETDTFSGSVLVAKDGQVLLRTAVGLASKRFDTPNNINTRFNLGSMNKMFTSVTILKLIEQGKLELNSNLASILGLSAQSKIGQVQIQHLLSHTSGIGWLDCEKGEESIVASFQSCREKLAKMELEKLPGSTYRYSNDGMFVLGLVIEHLTKTNYYQALNNYVLEPAKMSATECLDLQFPVRNAAIGYAYYGEQGTWRNNLFIHDKKGGPAGGCYSTVDDMYRFARVMLENKIISKEMTDLAWTPQTQFGSQRYGLGFITWLHERNKVVGHNGSFPGVSSQFQIHLDSGFTVVVLANHSFAADPVIAKFNQLFL